MAALKLPTLPCSFQQAMVAPIYRQSETQQFCRKLLNRHAPKHRAKQNHILKNQGKKISTPKPVANRLIKAKVENKPLNRFKIRMPKRARAALPAASRSQRNRLRNRLQSHRLQPNQKKNAEADSGKQVAVDAMAYRNKTVLRVTFATNGASLLATRMKVTTRRWISG